MGAESPESTQAEMGKQLEAAGSTQATMRKQIEALQRELAAVQDSAGFVPRRAQALERTPGSEQLATFQPGAKVSAQVPKPPGAVVGGTYRRFVQLP